MINKYFTVEVKPEIDANLLNAAALASDDDVIFTWTPFEVPKGSCRLLNVTARVASNDGTAQHHPFQLFFAKYKLKSCTLPVAPFVPTQVANILFNSKAPSDFGTLKGVHVKSISLSL